MQYLHQGNPALVNDYSTHDADYATSHIDYLDGSRRANGARRDDGKVGEGD